MTTRMFPLVLLTSCATLAPLLHPGYETQGDRVRSEASVRVLMFCDAEHLGFGSGVAVSSRHVLTARHVVEDERCKVPLTFIVIKFDGERVPMELDKVAGGLTWDELPGSVDDAARLVPVACGNLFETWAPIAQYRPRLGQTVYMVAGQYDRPPFIYKTGIVSGVSDEKLLLSGHFVPGNSGSAAFDSNGHVLGLVVSAVWADSAENWSQAIRPASWSEIIP